MALKITFGGADMMRVVAGTNADAGFLDPDTLFSGDYRPARVSAFEASSSTAFVAFGKTYAQPPFVIGALDTGTGQQAEVANLDYRWTLLGGGVYGYLLQSYSYCFYYIVKTDGISQYFYNRSGTARYLVLEP